jgi:murein L,D-transpeptidase YcbB/YkuD
MIRILALLLALLATPAAAQEPADSAALPPSGVRLDLNIPANRLRVLEGGRVIRTYRVSVGKPGHDTPDGSFRVQRAEWNPSWTPPPGRAWTRGKRFTPPGVNNPMGRVKLFFAPLYFIHGTPDTASVGQPASHGCVRMLNRDVVALARLLHERASPTVPPGEIPAILARPTRTRGSTLRADVPLTIRYDPVEVENGDIVIHPDIYERGRIHTEALYQALAAAGHDPSTLERTRLRAVLARAATARGPFRTPVDEVLR